MPTLEATAEQLAPAPSRTNYFDGGDDVIARYGNARAGMESSEFAANAASRLARSREDRLAQGRRQIDWDREDQEYREKQEFKAQRGQFLESISMIDPEADDFETQISEIYKALPPGARDDDAVGALISWKQKVYQDRLNEKDMAARREEAFNDRRALMLERYANDPRLASLSPDERNQFVLTDGSFDHVGAAQLAYQKTRQDKKDDTLDIDAKKRERRRLEEISDGDLSPAEKNMKKLAREHVLGDTEAFPNQVDALRKGLTTTKDGKPVPVKEEDLKKDPRYQDARLYESRKFESELESARNMTREEYIARGGSSESAKRKRGEVWDAAQYGGGEAPAADAGKPASKALDRETAVAILREAGGDKAKARQMAKERGYTLQAP